MLTDYGWTGWKAAPIAFCDDVLPRLVAANVTIPTSVTNDCSSSDAASAKNATAFQSQTAPYVGEVCARKNCSAFISVGDSFYDSGVDFTTDGLRRFEESWIQQYQGGIFDNARWYMTLGNHDIVPGQPAVDFQTQIAPLWDNRWFFGKEGAPGSTYYNYELEGRDFSVTVAHVDSDCFIEKYMESSSVYYTSYLTKCHAEKQKQVDFVKGVFQKSKADWKILTLHHPWLSATGNNTELWPLVEIVQEHKGVMLSGHDHCLGHYVGNNTHIVLSGAAGYPQAGDCNYGVPLGPYTKFLGSNSQAAANGFVTMDITKQKLNFEYYLRDMKYEGSDLFPVANDLLPYYSFSIDA